MSEKTEVLLGYDHFQGREIPEVHLPSVDFNDVPEKSHPPHALAVAASLDGLWEWDLQSDALQYSDRCSELLGYGKNEIPHTMGFFWNSLHPEDTEAVQNAVRRHLEQEGGTPTDVEYRLRTKQGEYRWFRARAQVRRDDSGRLTRMAGVIQDITDRKQVEKTLEERLRFEKLLADLSATFVNLPCEQTAGMIDDSLKMLVESLGIDRSTLAEFTQNKGQALVVKISPRHWSGCRKTSRS
jgi:PAS domain S-box-containing protein